MEANLTDALTEVRNAAATAAGEEQAITDLEHEVAETMRQICMDLFGGSVKYRIPTQRIRECDGDGQASELTVWQNVGTTLIDNVEWQNGDFGGDALVLRVSTNGQIFALWIAVPETRAYDLHSAEGPHGPWQMLYDHTWRLATDREIAANAESLAKDLLAALKKRIGTAKEHKATLRRVRDAMAGKDA